MPPTRLPRVSFGRPVSVLPEGDWQQWLHLESANLSLGGMFVLSDGAAVPRGTRVSLALEASGRLLEFAEAEVVHAAPQGFGVRFTHLRPRARALVEHLVARGGTGGGPVGQRRVGKKPVIVTSVLALVLGGVLGSRAHLSSPAAPPPIARHATAAIPIAPPPMKPVVREARTLDVAVPTGAVSSLRIKVSDKEVAVEPLLHRGVVIQRVFTLQSPSRLVIDLTGREPRYSWQLDGTLFKSVRVGARNHGTRVVVDLEDADKRKLHAVTPAGV